MIKEEEDKSKKEITASVVADFFIAKANEVGEVMTNLKLQKLVFYAQAWYLANYKKNLFEDEFQAWIHGPVIPELYQKYKERRSEPIISDLRVEEVEKHFNDEELEILNDVASIYMPFGAYQLEWMTHNETPWKEARGLCEVDERCSNVISKESIEKFYASQLKN